MLQSLSQSAERAQGRGRARGEAGAGEMLALARSFLRRRYLLVFVSTGLALALSVLYLRVTPPTYTAYAQILLDNPKAQFVRQESPLAEPMVDLAMIETQLQILRSPALAEAVIAKLNLADVPEFNPRPSFVAETWRKIRERLSSPPPAAPVDLGADSLPPQLGPFLDRLEARRVGLGNIIEISFSSNSGLRAAEIANAVAEAYVNDQDEAKNAASRRAIGWLQGRLQELERQARTAAEAVDAYKSAHNLVSNSGRSIDEQQVSDLNGRLVAAKGQTAEALARLNSFEAASRQNDPDTMSAAPSDTLNSPIINGLRTQYLELKRRESEWAPRFGVNHLAVVQLRDRMGDIRKSIHEEVMRFAANARGDYEIALQRQAAAEKQLEQAMSHSHDVDAAEIALRELQAHAKSYQSLYELFQQRYVGALQLESFPINEARVLSPALPPDSKSRPKSKQVLTLGVFGGLALGLALGLLRDLTDGVFRTARQVEEALELTCFSLVPSMRAPRAKRRAAAPPPALNPQLRLASNGNSIDSRVVAAPGSRFVEMIRAIKIGIDLSPPKGANRVIGVTSALPGEGKTTIAASLARLMAHGGKRTIIVDCDLRNPSLSNGFASGAAFGLLEVVSGERALEDAIWIDAKSDLAILPTVRRRQSFHSSETLSSQAMRALIDRLRAEYDYVIVDLPPLSPLVDARATGAFVDGYLLVIEWGRTRTEAIQHALRNAPGVYENVLGAVLNKTDMRAFGQYDDLSRTLYHERQYAHYGMSDEGWRN